MVRELLMYMLIINVIINVRFVKYLIEELSVYLINKDLKFCFRQWEIKVIILLN